MQYKTGKANFVLKKKAQPETNIRSESPKIK